MIRKKGKIISLKNWKMIDRDTWNKEWKHKKTDDIIRVTSEVTNASGWRTVSWTLELENKNKRKIIRKDVYELGDVSGEYMTDEDRKTKNNFIKIAKKMMNESDKYKNSNQFKNLVKKYKK